jgi:Spy/CpxP family protein refolding chaperone
MVDTTGPGSWRATLSVIAVFALGVVFGAALTFAIARHARPGPPGPGPFGPRHGGPMPVERMTRELDLDADQQAKVRAILERRHETMRGFLDETHREIREILRPDQREKFDRMRPPGPPPGGPGPPGPPPL